MFIDEYPETTSNPVLTDADLKSFKGERCSNPFDPARFTPIHPNAAPLPAPAPAPIVLPSVTEVEELALRGVDVALTPLPQ